MENDFNILQKKINDFVKKYYKNQMLKGLILSLAIIAILFLLINLVEYFAWSSVLVRTVIFYTFIAVVTGILIYYVAIPLFKILHIGKTISREEAALIIGKHFPEVSDRLLNVLQLKEQIDEITDKTETDLLIAGIDQKSKELSPVPFTGAIKLTENKRYLTYFLPPALIILLILIISPAFITEPSERIVHHSSYYEKPLPYTISIINSKLETLQHEDFTLKIRVSGEEIPSNIWITDGSYRYKMKEIKPGQYEYIFKDLNGDTWFQLKTEDYVSEKHKIKVFPKPVIFSFDVSLKYPAYLKKKADIIQNSGDLVVPEGSKITWKIYTRDTRHIIFKAGENEITLDPAKSNTFEYSLKASNNFFYTLLAENRFVKNYDSLSFSVQVIKDQYPVIEVNQTQDETLFGNLYFTGMISDDYGFHSLKFFHKTEGREDEKWETDNLSFSPDIPQQSFSYAFLTREMGLKPGESMSYFFEVRDNDAINGYKKTRTPILYLYLPDKTEIENMLAEKSEKVKKEIKQTLEELSEINKQIEEKRRDLIDKKELNWADKQQLAELFDKQMAMQEKLNQLDQLNEQIKNYEEIVKQEKSQQLKEKEDQLDQMFKDLTNEKLKKQLEKMKKELDKIDKKKLNKLLEELKKNNSELKTNLDQNLELYKQLEFQKKAEEAISKLDSLADKQKDLADKTKQKEIEKNKSLEEQTKINKEFDQVKKSLKETEMLNAELEEPFDFNPDTTEMNSIDEQLGEATQNLESGKQKKASQNQSQAGQKMKKMASNLNMMMQSAMQSRMGEDAEQVKKLLDNLIDLSFKLEKIMGDVRETSLNDPKYTENIDQINQINDDFTIVHDSLVAISKRQIMIQPFIVKESEKIKSNLSKATALLHDRKTGTALSRQQYAMTSINNLALMLSESLDKMQMSMQMSGNKPGQLCPTPGKGQQPSLQQISKMQNQLNKSMSQGEKSSGMKGKEGINGNSEELARMAALQSEIRRRLQEYIDQMKSNQGNGNALNDLVKEMEKTEKDIINRKISQETLERQKNIEVRLLQSEKALMEREKEKKRESKEGKNIRIFQKNVIFEVENKKNRNIKEIFLAVPIQMSPYYKELLSKYKYKYKGEHG
ncbi:MAG: hypothetical protein GXO86_13230, partial [Chlorobi bacterium]|nr:hypothetical protein [Chlorobiota bacterium]